MITLEEYKKTLTILFIEDDQIFTKKIKTILEKFFKSVLIANDGEEALKLFKTDNINLIISDINMPNMNGLEFLKKLRAINNDISFIFMTARNESNIMLQAIQLSISNYILKPINLNDFLLIINKIIEKDYKNFILKEKSYTIKLDNDFSWDKQTKVLQKNNISIKLTKNELMLLDLLLTSNNKIFTSSEIISHIWNEEYEEKDYISNLKNMISRLRNKIPQINIVSVYGLGYKINIIK